MVNHGQEPAEVTMLVTYRALRFGIIAVELIGGFEPWGTAERGKASATCSW